MVYSDLATMNSTIPYVDEQTLSLNMRGQTTGARSTTHVSNRYREFHNLVPDY